VSCCSIRPKFVFFFASRLVFFFSLIYLQCSFWRTCSTERFSTSSSRLIGFVVLNFFVLWSFSFCFRRLIFSFFPTFRAEQVVLFHSLFVMWCYRSFFLRRCDFFLKLFSLMLRPVFLGFRARCLRLNLRGVRL